MPWTPKKREMVGRVAEFMEAIRGKAWASVHGCVCDVLHRYVPGVSWSGTPKKAIAESLVASVVMGRDIIHKSKKLDAEQWDALIAEIEKCPEHVPKQRKPDITRLTAEQQERAINSNVEF